MLSLGTAIFFTSSFKIITTSSEVKHWRKIIQNSTLRSLDLSLKCFISYLTKTKLIRPCISINKHNFLHEWLKNLLYVYTEPYA